MKRRGDKKAGNYPIGYGRTPPQTRWPKGHSGNPNGRPAGARSKHRQLTEAMDQPTREMFLAEMCRPITVVSEGKKITMPVIKMIMRSMAKSAANGGQQAQRTALLVQLELERELAKQRAELMAAAREAKAIGEMVLARCRAKGLPEPDMLPHPDDIHIDEDRQIAQIRGPRTPKQKAALDKILTERDGYQRGVTGHQDAAEVKPRDWTLPLLAVMAQERFDIINGLLPERYRRKLENRMTPAQVAAAQEKARKALAARKQRRARRRGGGMPAAGAVGPP